MTFRAGGAWAVVVASVLLGPAAAAEPGDPLTGTGGLFDAFPLFNAHSPPVVCLVTTQDPAEIREALAKPEGMTKLLAVQRRLAELSGLPCLLTHYLQIRRRDLDKPNVKAIVLSSWKVPAEPGHAAELNALMRETKTPLLAFCGGHSLLYTAHGGKGAAMRPLKPGETDPNPKYFPGRYKEWGFMKVRVGGRDPLFAGLPGELVVQQLHYAECKQLPPGFRVLAGSEECAVQVIKDEKRLVYGTQFHPERYDGEHPHGRILIRNFLELAGCPAAPGQGATRGGG